jgi:hypothetical protein
MTDPDPRRPERSAGAFLGPDVLLPMSLRTLSDDYSDVPTDPPDDRVPEPEPLGLIRRIVDRLTGGPTRGL